jgi:hypothetical protein
MLCLSCPHMWFEFVCELCGTCASAADAAFSWCPSWALSVQICICSLDLIYHLFLLETQFNTPFSFLSLWRCWFVCVCVCVFFLLFFLIDDFPQLFSDVFFLGIHDCKDAEWRCSSRFSKLRSHVEEWGLFLIARLKLRFW